jgi:cholesterol transport system auxiliary component
MTFPLPRRIFLLSGLATFGLGGCSAISALGDATTPLDAYDLALDPALGPRASGGALARSLVVELPEVAGALDTDRILIRPNPLQAQYLPEARWTDPAPQLVQRLLVRNIEDSGALRYVGTRPLGAAGDFALISRLTDFQAEVGVVDIVTIRLRLSARLVRETDASVIASRVFEATAVAPSTDPLTLVQAFNIAAAILIPQTSRWALSTIGARISA